MVESDRAQAGRADHGDVRGRAADHHATPTPDVPGKGRGRTMSEAPNPNIIDTDTLTGEMRPIRRVVVGLGSNLGERLDNLQGAVDARADTPDVWITGIS